MDERIMHLVSLIADQVQTKQDLFRDEGKIMDSLMSSGYRLHEADAALTLLQTLSTDGDAAAAGDAPLPLKGGMRSMNTEERSRFAVDAFSFITKLAHLGVISVEQREDLLGKALSLHSGRIELGHVRSLLAFDLFATERDQDDILPTAPANKGTVWN